MVSLAAQEWMAEGVAQGRAEGVAQGKAEGVAQGRAEGEALGLKRALHRLLTARFGLLPDGVVARIDALPGEALEATLDRAVTAPDLAAVFDTGPRGPTA